MTTKPLVFDSYIIPAKGGGYTLDMHKVTEDYEREMKLRAGLFGIGMGDLHTQETSPGERYWDSSRTGRAIVPGGAGDPTGRAVAERPAPCLPPDLQKIIDCLCPAIEKAFACALDRCRPIITRPPNWLAPPVTAVPIDLFTAGAGVALPAGSGQTPGTATAVLTLDVTDRFVGIITHLGNEGEAVASDDIRWSMQLNTAPVRYYGSVDTQLGEVTRPTELAKPGILLPTNSTFRLIAQAKAATAHTAFARVQGWMWAARRLSADGSFSEQCDI